MVVKSNTIYILLKGIKSKLCENIFPMPKMLLVKTPQTTDGVTLRYDEDSRVVYKTTLSQIKARKHFESVNNALPKQLKHILSEVDVERMENGKYRIIQPKKAAVQATGQTSEAKPAGKKPGRKPAVQNHEAGGQGEELDEIDPQNED
jgi:hypothetical protein